MLFRSVDHDRVVELGIGGGALGRRILRRLGRGGVLVGVDYTQSLLDQARQNLTGTSQVQFEPVLADIRQLGPWLEGADVVAGRSILHHIPLVETFLGPLRSIVRYYQASGLSSSIGAALALTLESARYRRVRCCFSECPVDCTVIAESQLTNSPFRKARRVAHRLDCSLVLCVSRIEADSQNRPLRRRHRACNGTSRRWPKRPGIFLCFPIQLVG